jgi:hypothetical protein
MKRLDLEGPRLGGRGKVSLSQTADRPLDLQAPKLGGKGGRRKPRKKA